MKKQPREFGHKKESLDPGHALSRQGRAGEGNNGRNAVTHGAPVHPAQVFLSAICTITLPASRQRSVTCSSNSKMSFKYITRRPSISPE